MRKKTLGRPRKENAVRPGELPKGMCRFTFIIKEKLRDELKDAATKDGGSIKDYMEDMVIGRLIADGRISRLDAKLLRLPEGKGQSLSKQDVLSLLV